MRPQPLARIVHGLTAAVILCGALALQSCRSSPAPVDHPPGYPIGFIQRGVASWYGPGFHGNKTANGERYNMHQLTAAHRTLPLGSIAVVRSLTSGRQVTVRINDRGPFVRGRVLDLSLAGAKAIGMTGRGTDEIELRVIGYSPRPGGPGALRVQIGSFADPENAQTLFSQAQAEFPGGRITRVDLPEGRRYRVQIGQFRTESEAQAAAARLDHKLNVESFVVRDDG
ncbi:MAG: septal ring lytic transglycosylase RlpA family protein [Nitrospira sp.]|nr:septal ring lytic transglycosylase RlpA family protein [Nitrospira sp.]